MKASIRTKVTVGLLVAGVSCAVVTGWQGYTKGREALLEAAFERLSVVREVKKRQIESYFEAIRGHAASVARSSIGAEAVGAFRRAFELLQASGSPAEYAEKVRRHYEDTYLSQIPEAARSELTELEQLLPTGNGALALQYHYIAQDSPAGDESLVVHGPEDSEYGRVHARYHDEFAHLVEELGYYDLFLIDADSGVILYTVAKEVDLGMSLLSEPYADTNLGRVFKRARSGSQGVVTFVDFEEYAPSYMAPAAFVAAPIYQNGKQTGVLAMQLSIDRIGEIMTGDRQWRQEGLGETGESYIVGGDFTMRSNSRFVIEAPEAYLVQLQEIGTDPETIARIRAYRTSIRLQEVRTEASSEALSGRVDTRILTGYRGVSVLSAYGPLNIPGMNWAIVAEIDMAEITAPVAELKQQLQLAVGLIAALAIVFGALVARMVTGPLLTLTQSVHAFRQGRRDHRVVIRSDDEIGGLGEAFNEMAAKIEEEITEAEQRLTERKTAEKALRAAKEEAEQAAVQVEAARRSMSDLLANLPTHIMMADRDLNITYANPAMTRVLESLKDALPVAPDRVVGSTLGILHQDSSHLIEVLSDPQNLPHRARIQIGPEVVNLLITAIYDQDGEYSGPMVTWEIITEEVRLEQENRAAAERERQQAERERQQAEEERRRSQELQEKVDSMLEVVRAAEKGDLTHKITVGGEDTIGQMGAGLKQFLGELREDIGVISENVRRMTEASNTMMDVSQQMGANAEEASSQTNEVSASARTVRNSLQSVASAVEELTASISEISSNAGEASKMATGAVDMTESTHAVITKLGESSSKISDIIKLITSIAEQTNLLALNASIEAGRAGEAGKSFAVVASEVKQLSQEIAESAGNVRAQIEAIQSDTRNAVEAIREVSTTIEQINRIQAAIAGAVNEQAMTANEISQNIIRAAEGSVNISDHVDSVAETARHTASGAGDTQAAASQLAEMASELQAFVSKFRVGEADLEGREDMVHLIEAVKAAADRSGDGQMAEMASEVMKLLSELQPYG